jgi:ASC-1-like (ASCH) protein
MDSIKEFNVSEPWFSYISKGKKCIEGRLFKGQFKDLKKNDIIKWTNNDNSVTTKIIKILRYNSFEEYLTQEGLKRTLPGILTLQDGINTYYKYYTKEQEKEYGIMAIYIKRL